jgi:hypothetical protein
MQRVFVILKTSSDKARKSNVLETTGSETDIVSISAKCLRIQEPELLEGRVLYAPVHSRSAQTIFVFFLSWNASSSSLGS